MIWFSFVQEREEELQRSILHEQSKIEAQSWENVFQSVFEQIVPQSVPSVIILPIDENVKQWEILARSTWSSHNSILQEEKYKMPLSYAI